MACRVENRRNRAGATRSTHILRTDAQVGAKEIRRPSAIIRAPQTMPFVPGARLGVYEIRSTLGAGGMDI
jgi:hypothetical protein